MRLTLVILLCVHLVSQAQIKKLREYQRGFQLSLFPGISTNGIESGSYYNKFSFNIFGGLSAGNHHLEIGLISNVNLKKSTGIQIAGFGNIVGTNAFVNLTLSEERALIHNDFECNFTGIQLSAVLNYVRDNAKGIQLTAGQNVNGIDFRGFQVAGIGNSAGSNSFGFHLAGMYNIAGEHVGGIQLTSIFNYARQELAGAQIALINKAGQMRGRKSTPPSRARSLQIGLLNFCKEMEGTQIGLINFGGEMRGKQFGLINFFNAGGTKEYSRNGTPVGLLNFGSKGSVTQLSTNELLSFNLEITTGNCLNCTYTQSEMPYADFNKIFNQNALIIGYDYFKEIWGFGYGFQKILVSKHSMNPKDKLNEQRLINYGVKFLHLNKRSSFDKDFNLLTKLNVEIGRKLKGKYVFCGLSVNYFLIANKDEDRYEPRSFMISAGELMGSVARLWPGYTAGIQL